MASLTFGNSPVKHLACRLSDKRLLASEPMKPLSDIRRDNLAILVKEAGGQVAVANKIQKNKNQIYQWLLNAEEKAARNIGHASARLLETTFKKPLGWLDQTHSDSVHNPEQRPIDNRASPASRPVRLDLGMLMLADRWTDILGRIEEVEYDRRTKMERFMEVYLLMEQDGGDLSGHHQDALMEAASQRKQEREKQRTWPATKDETTGAQK